MDTDFELRMFIRDGDRVSTPGGRCGVVLQKRGMHGTALVLRDGDQDSVVFDLDQLVKA